MTKDENLTDWKTNASKRRVRSLAGTTLLQIFELYPDTPIAVHLVNILRSKGKLEEGTKAGTLKFRDPYFMRDQEILKEMEVYREALDMDALESLQKNKEDEFTR